MVEIAHKRIVVVTEWHPWEHFAVAVGRLVEERLKKEPIESVIVAKYKGRYSDNFLRQKWLFRFAEKYAPLDYLVDLHNRPYTPEEILHYRRIFPNAELETTVDQAKKYFEKTYANEEVTLYYYTRRKVPAEEICKMKCIGTHLKIFYTRSDMDFGDGLEREPPSTIPVGYDKVSVEFNLPHRLDHYRASDYVVELVRLLHS